MTHSNPTNPLQPPARQQAPAASLAYVAPAAVPRTRLIDIDAVCNIVGRGRTSVYDLVRKGQFPQPVKFSRRCSRWDENAILTWVQSQIQQGGAA